MSQPAVASLFTEYLRCCLALRKIWELHSRDVYTGCCPRCDERWPCQTAKIIMDIDDLPSIPPAAEEAGA